MKNHVSKWKPGVSGNPKGRPKGTGKVSQLRTSLEKNLPQVIAALVKKAKGGDIAAIRLIIDRVIPPIKAIDMPAPLILGDSPMEGCRQVFAAVERGKITPGQALQLAQGLATMARVEELQELKDRLTALEATVGRPNN